MKKKFNINGICYPDKHYMVDLENRLTQIKEMIDYGDYFVINRARQFGKTTTLYALEKYLRDDYVVLSVSFQGLSAVKFSDEILFSKGFAELLAENIENLEEKEVFEVLLKELYQGIREDDFDLVVLFNWISRLCKHSEKPVVLIVDEVDSAANNQVFLDFLGLLRDYYLKREKKPAFWSVILAGVYDIKNLKHKIRPEEEHKYNSPWNISADFNVNMSFAVEDIAGMLADYEKDYQSGMDIQETASLIYEYTSGYPYLVSYLCKEIAEYENGSAWTRESILRAVKKLLSSRNTLFDDMIKHLNEYEELSCMLQNILFKGQLYSYNAYNFAISIGEMFGFIVNHDGEVAIANRIFETSLYDYFMSEEITKKENVLVDSPDRNQFILDGRLEMDRVMEKFVEYFSDIYRASDDKFVEEYGRKIFLLYLKPIINGTGNYYIEACTRDRKRTDVIVDYRGEQFVIELKIWRGEEYHNRGEKQLAEYLNAYHLKKGWLLSFNFNKKKEVGIKRILCGDKEIVEAVV